MVFFWLALVSRAQVYGRSYYQKYILYIRHYSSSLVQMQAKEGERSSSSSSRSSTSCRSKTRESRGAQRLSGARAVIFFLWVILIFTHLSFCVAKLEEADANADADRLSRFLPRKARFLETTTTMATTTVPFHASSLSPSESADLINEDEKRIVHTGPNPLHN